jgi:transposase
VEAVPRLVARDRARRRPLPADHGAWNSVYRRFSRRCRAGVWAGLFEALAADPVLDLVATDATIARAHQHAAGAKGGLRPTPSVARAAA